jgi:hypothetical protein
MEPRSIDVLSDSTGETAEKVVRAALLQFPESGAQVRLHTRVRTKEAARPVLERAAQERSLVVFTVVSPELREYLHATSHELHVEALDLIGSLIGKLGTYLERQPINTPSSMLPLSDEYFRRIEAVEFTVKNDDGREPRALPKADIVLVGISRTSKTPLSTYLAQKGYKVANVPLVLGIPAPEELALVDEERVFGLTIRIEELLRIRQTRLQHLGMPPDTSYAQREHIAAELAYAQQVFRQHPGWPVIDITGKAIEETAANVIRIIKDRQAQRGEEPLEEIADR